MNKASVQKTGAKIHDLARRLWPICRSITGPGVRETLSVIAEYLPELVIHEVPTGTPCFDWHVPREWIVRDAYVIDPKNRKIVDFRENNLHLVGYSVPVDGEFELDELNEHLYSLPDQPTAIPYITSYYKERWGFCLTEIKRRSLEPGKYRVRIESELKDGSLTYGEMFIKGTSEKEVLLSTYICHPSMANNELSGPCVTTFLAKYLLNKANRKYSYRIVYIPETIGSICYLSKNLDTLKKNVIAGFVITCVGDERAYSYLASRKGGTLADAAAKHALEHIDPSYRTYSFLERGSDERQYCSPGVDLPIASIMRSKYGTYPEYHTSLDDLDFVTPDGLEGGFNALKQAINVIEKNRIPKVKMLCEPQLGRRGLYPSLSTKKSHEIVKAMMNLIAYADGDHSLLQIADRVGSPFVELESICARLEDAGVIESEDPGFDLP